jgi:hypothetical protein
MNRPASRAASGSSSGLAARSLVTLGLALARRWWPQVAALAAACGVVTTVVVGALGVGDGIQRGLLDLAVARLGRIEAAVVADGFFRRELADEMVRGQDGVTSAVGLVPAVVMPATIAAASRSDGQARGTLLACDDPAALGFEPAPPPLAPGSVLVNAAAAAAVGIEAGDTIVVRLPQRSAVPADSPLGRRTGESRGRRVTVVAVLPDAGLGRFSLRPTQVTPPLVVMSLTDAQAILREGDVANTIFAVWNASAGNDMAAWLRGRLHPTLADYGLDLAAVAADGPLRLTSRRLVVAPEIDRVAADVLAPYGGRPSLAFLANELAPLETDGRPAEARIPYSTVLGIDDTSLSGGPLVDAAGATLALPAADAIIIDRWMADDLAAQGRPVTVGDRLVVRFFLPETIHGRVEKATASFVVAGIAEMRGAAVDRSLVPDVEGVTDEASIADWDPPFPFDSSRVRTVPPHDEDDRYWKQYRATPKAFVSLATARRLAGSRFGGTTAWHVPAGITPSAAPRSHLAELAHQLAAAIQPEKAGFTVAPLRAEAIAAARGSTPFGGLFLALSGFVVAAGLLLAWLLFGLLVAAQRQVIGLLAAVGWPPSRLARLLLVVGGIAAAAGALVGAMVGPVWSWALLRMLAVAWNRDVAPGSAAVFATGRPAWETVATGAVATLAMALVAVAFAARRAARMPPHGLLAGLADGASAASPAVGRRTSHRAFCLASAGLAAAVVTALAGRTAEASTAVGLFFLAGFTALVGLLTLVRGLLAAPPRRAAVCSLPQLASRMLRARPARAFSIAAIVACGQFLIVAVSAFALRPPADPGDRSSATGGWTSTATFGEPTSVDPTDPDVRATLGLSPAQEQALATSVIARLRSSDGDDASCTNLYATGAPVILGVGADFIARGGFRFVTHATRSDEATPPEAIAGNPWLLLSGRDPAAMDSAIPAMLDQATAQWGLKLGGVGSRFMVLDETGTKVPCEIVGLLEPGILQGRVIVAERDFQKLFPSRSGYSMALVDAAHVPAAVRSDVAGAMRAAWTDAGVAIEPTLDRVRSLQAVQNTFLAGFQALGTLGLLLGTAGVAAVMLQGVVERIGSLAVLRAVGFTLARVRWLLVLESLVTVGLGLAIGTAAGAVAVWPALAGGTARLPLAWIAATGGLTLAAAAAAGWLATAGQAVPERPR